MEKELKKLLKELKGKETSRKDALDVMRAEVKRIDLRQETEEERFAGERDKDGNWLKRGGIYDDIRAGVYNHVTEGQMQKVIDDELRKIKQRYDVERAQLSQKIEETQKSQEEEKKADYKKISTGIKDYHLDMVLEVNKQNKILTQIEAERNGKLEEIDKLIAEKEAEKTHLIMKNRNFMDIEASEAGADIRALGEDIERLKAQKEGINDEYVPKLKEQSDTVQYYSQQKERAAKFMGSIILTEKSVDEIYDILFGKGKKKENQSEQSQKQESQEQQSQRQQNQNGKSEGEQVEQTQGEPIQAERSENDSGATSKIVPNETEQEEQENVVSSEEEIVETKPVVRDGKNIFSYSFSAQGISYEGRFIDRASLLKWYNKDKSKIESALKSVLGEKEQFEDFSEFSDKFAYLSMIYRGSKDVNGELILDDETKFRLNEYYDVWTNPEKREKSNMLITYDLKNTSGLARLFNRTKFTKEQIDSVKENAFLLRKRKDVKIEHGFFSRIEFYVKEKIESARKSKLLGTGIINPDKENSNPGRNLRQQLRVELNNEQQNNGETQNQVQTDREER